MKRSAAAARCHSSGINQASGNHRLSQAPTVVTGGTATPILALRNVTMDSLLSGLISLAILVADIWAVVSVWRSEKSSGTKLGWTLLIFILPVVGLIIWGIMGPRALVPPTSSTHSKG